jgi:hypothetical protein
MTIVFRFHSLYLDSVNRFTKQELFVLCMVLSLLLLGWIVKAYRTAHPPAATIQTEAAPVTLSEQAKQ